MSYSVKLIREALEVIIEALPQGFTKLENKFVLEKNNTTNLIKRYGVISMDGDNADNVSVSATITKRFEITLANKFISTNHGDVDQQEVYDILEDMMEDIVQMINHQRLGIPEKVINTLFLNNDEIDSETIENLAFLRFNINITYVINDYCTP